MEALADLRKHVQGGKLVTGTRQVVKLLRGNKLARVFVSSNCPQPVRDDLKRYCGLAECEFVEIGIPNDELRIICKKPFSISVVGIHR